MYEYIKAIPNDSGFGFGNKNEVLLMDLESENMINFWALLNSPVNSHLAFKQHDHIWYAILKKYQFYIFNSFHLVHSGILLKPFNDRNSIELRCVIVNRV